MTKKKFNPGQKIAFYDAGLRYVGRVIKISGYSLTARGADGNEFELHIKQCWKLKPKAKNQRRFTGVWKRMHPNAKSDNQQMAFVPTDSFINLMSLEGTKADLIQTKSKS